MTTEYPTLKAFYDADARREPSREADYGAHWTDAHGGWPYWRVSYIQATGEVYAIAQSAGQGGPVRVLGTVRPDPVLPGASGRNQLWYRTLEHILDGYADPDVTGRDLAWVAGRLAAYRPAA